MPIEANPTSYTALDFLKWQRDGTLDLRPPFQRGAVWRPILKSSLIDSILRGYPIPALFLQDRSDSATFSRRLVVIDGQQRLRTIIGFIDHSSLKDSDDRDMFAISRVHDKARAGKRFNELSEADRDRILSTRLSVYVVGSSVTNAELLEIFRRMNTYGAKLNAQELRNAEYSGVFNEVASRLSADMLDEWLSWGIFNRQQIAEMRDTEFVSDLMLLLLSGRQSSTKSVLDKAYQDHLDDFAGSERVMTRFASIFAFLRTAFRNPAQVSRLSSRMWLYSLVDAVQELMLGGPIASTRKDVIPVTRSKFLVLLENINESIDAGDLPDNVGRATRGAANDKASREA